MTVNLKAIAVTLAITLSALGGYIVRDEPDTVIVFNVTYIEPSNLRDFKNRAELEDYLFKDDTDSFVYTDHFTCVSFAKRLSRYAAMNGYHIATMYDEHHLSNYTHVYNMAYCIDEDAYYIIEPQNDKILWKWRK